MKTLRLQSAAKQVAAHLREEVYRGGLYSLMPGKKSLSAELGVNHKTVEAALGLLEAEGLLVSRGSGRRRRIVLPKHCIPPSLRVGLLLYEPADHYAYDTVALRHRLLEVGHAVSLASKTLTELGMDVRRIARVVQNTKADAWVVLSASSEVLTWFAEQPTPAIAYAGQYPSGMPLASVAPGRQAAMVELVRQLVSLGHRRVVFLTGSGIKPYAFLKELEAQGIKVGPYNAPHCEYSPDEFRRCLDALFETTPPTALLIDEARLFFAAQHHLARRGLFAPEHVSLVCSDPDPTFAWCEPTVAHIHWDRDLVVRRILKWVANVNRGKDDRCRTLTKAELVDGGTIGPAPS